MRRLVLMPPFLLIGSSPIKLSVMCLSTARLWAVALVLARIWSSLKETSIVQWRRFSTDQWARTA